MARKCATCGGKKVDCIQKIFNVKNIVYFCGFNIKIENLIFLHFLKIEPP